MVGAKHTLLSLQEPSTLAFQVILKQDNGSANYPHMHYKQWECFIGE